MLANTLPMNCVFGPLLIFVFEVQPQQFAQASLGFAISLPRPPEWLGSQVCIRRPGSCFMCVCQLTVHLIFQSLSSRGLKKVFFCLLLLSQSVNDRPLEEKLF